jgi:CRP/FNR family cyclic AMP-dependent transcriptional regulator
LTIAGKNDRVNLKNDGSPATRQEWDNVSMAFLKSIRLFEGISEEEARKIARLCFERAYPKGTAIFSEGDPSDGLYIVKGGLVKLTSLSETGTEAIHDILKQEEIFGELLITEKARAFTATAIEDAVVTVIPRERFLELLSLVPTVSRNFIRFLSKRLVKVEKGVADSSHSWSYHRLARALLQLGEKYGEKTPAGTLIRLRLTHEDLSNLIGTTRETVTTQLNKFERMGLLNRQGRQLIVIIPRLSEFISSEELRMDKSLVA